MRLRLRLTCRPRSWCTAHFGTEKSAKPIRMPSHWFRCDHLCPANYYAAIRRVEATSTRPHSDSRCHFYAPVRLDIVRHCSNFTATFSRVSGSLAARTSLGRSGRGKQPRATSDGLPQIHGSETPNPRVYRTYSYSSQCLFDSLKVSLVLGTRTRAYEALYLRCGSIVSSFH
jgi:hypothetical protein